MEGRKAAWVVVVVMMLVCAAREAKAQIGILNESDTPLNVVARVNANTIVGNVTVGARLNGTLPVTVGARVNLTFLNLVTNVTASANVTAVVNLVLVIRNIPGLVNQVVILVGTLLGSALTLVSSLISSL